MKYTLKEWRAEGVKRFGKNIEDWKFICPACGKISSGKEFKNAGANSDDMYSACIGRFTGKGSPQKNSEDGCNWAAYGLLGTLGKGDIVKLPDGKEIEVFKMAEVEE